MTNKDILEQICHDCYNCKDCGFRSRGLMDRCVKIEVADYVMEVKDQQFKEYMEKKLEKYANGGKLIILDIINELFNNE